MTLLCLPYAGGTAAAYRGWAKSLSPTIKCMPVELKGRGIRYNEGYYIDIEDAVNDIVDQIELCIVKDDYAVFGHSMGSLLAYELYYKIMDLKLRKPTHMFFSGHRAPCCIKRRWETHKLSNADFIKEVASLGGIPNELLQNDELLELITERLRNDFILTDNYVYKDRNSKIDCNMSVFDGVDDNVETEELLSWKKHGCYEVKIYRFRGGHFFINQNVDSILSIIKSALKN